MQSQIKKEMSTTIENVFQGDILLNKLSSCQKFYTTLTKEMESILKFSNHIRQLAATLKSMSVGVPQSRISMALLNDLRDECNEIISTFDAAKNEERNLSQEFVLSRVMKEKQRIRMRKKTVQEKLKLLPLFLATAWSTILGTVKPSPATRDLVRSVIIVRILNSTNQSVGLNCRI